MNNLKTMEQIEEIVSRVHYESLYPNWKFNVFNFQRGGLYLQITFDAPDMVTGKPVKQFCRKWILDPYMTETEIVSTCFNATRAAEDHEMRERFRYAPAAGLKPRAIFQPHITVDSLWENCGMADLDIQEGEKTGEWVKNGT